MKENYFVINGVTYVVIYKNLKEEFFVKENDILRPLSKKEQQVIADLKENNQDYISISKNLSAIIISNKNFPADRELLQLMGWLESVILEDCREDFYRNLSTLTFDFHASTNELANYRFKENKININPSLNGQCTKSEYYQTILHEMVHMSSTEYDAKTGIIKTGFDVITRDDSKINRGLTEGMTEFMSMVGVPNTREYLSGCYIEVCLLSQIMQIIENEIILRSFYKYHTTKMMEENLTMLGFDANKAYELFKSIEMNYNLRKSLEKQNILGNIQSLLLDYLEAKCNSSVITNQEQFNNMMFMYESMLVTNEKLQKNGKNPLNYEGINESVAKFYVLKEKYQKQMSKVTKHMGISLNLYHQENKDDDLMYASSLNIK